MPVGRKLPAVDVSEDGMYFHVRMRSPSPFDTCRIPEWARRTSQSISKGSQVVICKRGKGKDTKWLLQSVQILKGNGKNKRDAKRLAIKIRNKIES